MTKILVLGANGYIGRHITLNLAGKNYCVIPADVHDESFDSNNRYRRLDVRDSDALFNSVNEVDYVFNFSGLTGTMIGFEKYREFIEINEIGLLNLLDAIRKANRLIKVIFPSTRLVYKGLSDVSLKEDSLKEFKTVYALNKYACEKYLDMYQKLFSIPYQVFRICVPYGNEIDNKYSYGTINHFISKARSGESLTIYGDGAQKRSFIHITDLTEIVIRAALNSKADNQIFNIGGNDVLSIKEVASMIAEQFNVEVNSINWPVEMNKLESGDTIFNSDKIDRIIQYEYQHDFSNWLKSIRTQCGYLAESMSGSE